MTVGAGDNEVSSWVLNLNGLRLGQASIIQRDALHSALDPIWETGECKAQLTTEGLVRKQKGQKTFMGETEHS